MPSILTSPPAIEPVSLAEAKAHLRIGHSDDDEAIARLIAAARRHVEAHTGLCLIAQGWSHFRDDWPETGIVELPQAPVSSVDEVIVYGDDDTPATIDPAHYHADLVSRRCRLLLRGSRYWARPGRIGNGIEIQVTAGFGAAATDVPAELRQAILELAGHWYAHRGDGDPPPLPLSAARLIDGFREIRL